MEPSHQLDVSQSWTLEDVVRASQGARLELLESDRKMLDQARQRVLDRLDPDTRVYGFNTGFGDNRNRPTIAPELQGVIQDNLILSHASGYGDPMDEEVVRSAIAIRAHSLALGHSAVRGTLVEAVCALANGGDIPKVPRFGSVGASGDLAPLSHLFLPFVQGDQFSEFRFDERSFFGPKEGLALNNGTTFMTAHLALAVDRMESLLWHADLALALSMEAMCGVLDAHAPGIQALRPHHWVNKSAAWVLRFLEGSQLAVSRGEAADFARQARTRDGQFDSVQDDYCLRCGPVVHGTAWQATEHARQVVETELNSVNDNPVVVGDDVLSGAHFHGMPLAFAADQLRTAMAIVGGISERRVAKLMNDKRNYGLPRHLVKDDPHGVKSGWMIAQYLCASLVNELKTRSMPYCVGNVTTGNEAEDFVSMGANACRAAYECVEHLRGIVAVELAAATRALMIRVDWEQHASSRAGLLSPAARSVIETLEKEGIEVGHSDDRPLEPIIAQTAELIRAVGLRSSLG